MKNQKKYTPFAFIVVSIFCVAFSSVVSAEDIVKLPSEKKAMMSAYEQFSKDPSSLSTYDKKVYLLLRTVLFKDLGADKKTNNETIRLAEQFAGETKESYFKAISSSATCRSALFVKATGRKMLSVRKCSLGLDKLIRQEPNNVDILMLRGSTYASLPSFFKKKPQAIADFEKVIGLVGENHGLELLAARELAVLYKDDNPSKAAEYEKRVKELENNLNNP